VTGKSQLSPAARYSKPDSGAPAPASAGVAHQGHRIDAYNRLWLDALLPGASGAARRFGPIALLGTRLSEKAAAEIFG